MVGNDPISISSGVLTFPLAKDFVQYAFGIRPAGQQRPRLMKETIKAIVSGFCSQYNQGLGRASFSLFYCSSGRPAAQYKHRPPQFEQPLPLLASPFSPIYFRSARSFETISHQEQRNLQFQLRDVSIPDQLHRGNHFSFQVPPSSWRPYFSLEGCIEA